MNSEFNQELISSYLDGELTSKEDRECVEEHLAASAEDARLLADFREMGDLLRGLPSEKTPAGMSEAVLNQIERETLLPQSATQPSSVRSSTRVMRSVAAVSVLTLFVCVGTIYYGQNQSSSDGLQTGTPLVADHAVSEGTSDLDAVMLERGLDETRDEEYKKSFFDKASGFGGTETAMNTVGGRGSLKSRSEGMPPSGSKTHSTAPLAAATSVFENEIPPLPVLLSKRSVGYINTLAASPKLQGILEPGELVQYVCTSSVEQNVSVVELSVVDVEEAFGTIQVLLSSNQIDPVSRIEQSMKADKEKTEHDSEEPKKGTSVAQKKPSSEKGEDELADSNELSEEMLKKQIEKEGMVAFYVEASDEQVLNCLTQVNKLEMVQEVHFGNTINLNEESYEIESLDGNTAMNFSISQQTLPVNKDRVDSIKAESAKKSSEEQTDNSLAKKTDTPSTPQWRVLNGIAQNQHAFEREKASSSRKVAGIHSSKQEERKEGEKNASVPSSRSHKVKGQPEVVAEETPFAPAVVSASRGTAYQMPVRLLPQLTMKQKLSHSPSAAAQANDDISTKQAVVMKDGGVIGNQPGVSEKNPADRKRSENRLRMLLIISLKEEGS